MAGPQHAHSSAPGGYPLTRYAIASLSLLLPSLGNLIGHSPCTRSPLNGRVVEQHWAVVEPLSSKSDWVSYHYYVGLLKISEDKVSAGTTLHARDTGRGDVMSFSGRRGRGVGSYGVRDAVFASRVHHPRHEGHATPSNCQ